jgi:hypothetical protein
VTNLIVNLIAGMLVRLLFIAFVVMLGLWFGLDAIGSDVNVIEMAQNIGGSFQEVADILGSVK